jgi:hypothetical protein
MSIDAELLRERLQSQETFLCRYAGEQRSSGHVGRHDGCLFEDRVSVPKNDELYLKIKSSTGTFLECTARWLPWRHAWYLTTSPTNFTKTVLGKIKSKSAEEPNQGKHVLSTPASGLPN